MEISNTLFFYGTLRDIGVLRPILGESMDSEDVVLIPAHARDRRAADCGSEYPVLAHAPGRRLAGALLRGVTEAALARLEAYEGPEYRLGTASVQAEGEDCAVEALVFEPVAPPSADAPDWSYEAWLESGAEQRRTASAELGALLDLLSTDAEAASDGAPGAEALAEIVELWPDLLGAAARRRGSPGPIRAALGPAFSREGTAENGRERVYDGFFKVDRLLLRRRSFASAALSEAAFDRLVFRVGEAVGVLPYDPHCDRVLLIEQFRPGPWAAGEAEPWMVEIIAGRIDKASPGSQGDPVEETARREALEEAGATLGRLERFDLGYASPGATDETLALFLAEARLPPMEGDAGLRRLGEFGLAEEGEDIRVFSLGFEPAMEALSAGEIRNMPAQLALLWLARRRPQLRALWSRPGPLDATTG